MSKLIGFIGKGGTGKSTISALVLKHALNSGVKPILVIDSDPNSCLGELLALRVESTIGNIKQDLIKMKNDASGTSISKYDYCEYALNNSVIESNGFDMVVMGKPAGSGCYCMINNVVQIMIEKLKKNYRAVIVDCEAGLEHLSRKTLGNIDTAFIISDLSRKGVATGIKQACMMKELDIKTGKNYLIINNVMEKPAEGSYEGLTGGLNNTDLEFAGFVRNDKNIAEFEMAGKSLLNLPGKCIALNDIETILEKVSVI